MRIQVKKDTKDELLLLFNPMEWMQDTHSCQSWYMEFQTNPGEILKDGLRNVSHPGSAILRLIFDTEDNLKAWVVARILPLLSAEEYVQAQKVARG